MYGKNSLLHQHDVIYGESYTDYEAALQTGKIEKLSERRLKRCLDFSLNCLDHPKMSKKCPKNPNFCESLRFSEMFTVNFADITISTVSDTSMPIIVK